jgi:hypothetical protein
MAVSQPTDTTKQQARQLLEQLPDSATWDDVVYEFAVALAAAPHRGRVVPEFQRADVREILVAPYRIIYLGH